MAEQSRKIFTGREFGQDFASHEQVQEIAQLAIAFSQDAPEYPHQRLSEIAPERGFRFQRDDITITGILVHPQRRFPSELYLYGAQAVGDDFARACNQPKRTLQRVTEFRIYKNLIPGISTYSIIAPPAKYQLCDANGELVEEEPIFESPAILADDNFRLPRKRRKIMARIEKRARNDHPRVSDYYQLRYWLGSLGKGVVNAAPLVESL